MNLFVNVYLAYFQGSIVIGIKRESRIQIRIGITTLPVRNTGKGA
jgi:hypothetical protein